MALAATSEAVVGDGLELRLGREVPLFVEPAREVRDALAIEVGGIRYIAPLGPAYLGIGRWTLCRADDDWAELVSDGATPAFASTLQLAPRITLLSGDALALERRGPPVFEVLDSGP